MAHFAEIDSNNEVVRVLVVGADQEHRGAEFLAADLGLGGTWIQCSYNGNIRKQYCGPGYLYDPVGDVFIASQPFPSWALDVKHDWQPPTPSPKPEKNWRWDEQALSWVAV